MQYSKSKMIILIISTVFSFTSSCIAFYLMGTGFIYFYAISAVGFFIPYAFIVSEYTAKLPEQQGGIYSWLRYTTSEKFAFSMNFLWYSGYIVWMVTLFTKMVLPLSYILFGSQVHSDPTLFANLTTFALPIALVTVLIVTFFAMKGVKNILNLALISGILLFVLCFITVIFLILVILYSSPSTSSSFITAAPPLTTTYDFFTPQNIMLLSFAITAFGGLDTIASLVGKIKNNHKQFSKAIILSGFITVFLYIVMISLWNLALPRQSILDLNYVHLGNIMYVLMDMLALNFSQLADFSPTHTLLLQDILLRFTGLVMLVMYISLLSMISYSPLKTLVEGTPSTYWPQRVIKKNHHGVATYALALQMLVITILIVLATSRFSNIREIYNQLSIMTNLSRSLPYFIVAYIFWQYVARSQGLLFFKNKWIASIASFTVIIIIGSSILSTIVEQLRSQNILSAILMIIGPIICITIAMILHYFYLKKKSNNSMEGV